MRSVYIKIKNWWKGSLSRPAGPKTGSKPWLPPAALRAVDTVLEV